MKKLLLQYNRPNLRQLEQKVGKKVCISSSPPSLTPHYSDSKVEMV